MKIMLADLINQLQYFAGIVIYDQNAYDQNVLMYKGAVRDIDADANCELMEYYTAQVTAIVVCDKNKLLIKIRTDNYNVRAQDMYSEEYVTKWKSNDSSTRPWKWSIETEEYTGW